MSGRLHESRTPARRSPLGGSTGRCLHAAWWVSGVGQSLQEGGRDRAAEIIDRGQHMRPGQFVGVVAAADRDSGHAGASRGLDAERRVLEHDAVLRCHAQALGDLDEDVRFWLAAQALVATDDGVRSGFESKVAQREFDVVAIACGADANLEAAGMRARGEGAKPGNLAELRRKEFAVERLLLPRPAPSASSALNRRPNQLVACTRRRCGRSYVASDRPISICRPCCCANVDPRLAVMAHRVDHRAVHVKNQGLDHWLRHLA